MTPEETPVTFRHPLTPLLSLALPLALAIAACSEEGPAGMRGLASTPLGSATLAPSAGPSTQATATPTSAPTATPTAAATAVATLVTITPATVSLWLPAGLTGAYGTALDFPSTATLSAVVTFSNGSTGSAVTWQSLSPSWVAVSAQGVVSALATDALSVPPPTGVRVRATSQDGQASAERSIDLGTDGGVAVIVQ